MKLVAFDGASLEHFVRHYLAINCQSGARHACVFATHEPYTHIAADGVVTSTLGQASTKTYHAYGIATESASAMVESRKCSARSYSITRKAAVKVDGAASHPVPHVAACDHCLPAKHAASRRESHEKLETLSSDHYPL